MKKYVSLLIILCTMLGIGISAIAHAAEINVTVTEVFTDTGTVTGTAEGTGGYDISGGGLGVDTEEEVITTEEETQEDEGVAQESEALAEEGVDITMPEGVENLLQQRREEIAQRQAVQRRYAAEEEQEEPNLMAAILPVTGLQLWLISTISFLIGIMSVLIMKVSKNN